MNRRQLIKGSILLGLYPLLSFQEKINRKEPVFILKNGWYVLPKGNYNLYKRIDEYIPNIKYPVFIDNCQLAIQNGLEIFYDDRYLHKDSLIQNSRIYGNSGINKKKF